MNSLIDLAKKAVTVQIDALQVMAERISEDFVTAVEIIQSAKGRVIILGMGKSGIVGKKIASTFASTGTPAFFVHPGEAFHGDLGMIKRADIALLISNSGETEEVIRLLPFLQDQKNKIIAMTGAKNSTLAKNSEVVLDVSVDREACTNNLAPTSSTTATLVMGDTLAVVLASQRKFMPEDFARFHPGGSLGRKLLTRVCDVMHQENLPICSVEDSFRDVVHIINSGRLGLAIVKNAGKLAGIITDGDLRRAFDVDENHKNIKAEKIMSREPKMINYRLRCVEAEELMNRYKINSLIAINDDGEMVGIIQIYDLVENGAKS